MRVWSERLEGKRPLVKPRRRWEDDPKIDFKEIWGEGVNRIHMLQDRDQWRVLTNTVLNL